MATARVDHDGISISVMASMLKTTCMSWQVPRVGMPAPATALASLAVYPFPDAGAATDVLRALGVLAEACAPLPQVSFAGCLAHACGAQSCLARHFSTAMPECRCPQAIVRAHVKYKLLR